MRYEVVEGPEESNLLCPILCHTIKSMFDV